MRQSVARFFSSPELNIKFTDYFIDYIQPIATKLNLGMPTEARPIKGQNREFSVTISIAKRHLINRTHVKYLTGHEQALTAKFLSFYTDKPYQPLRIYSYASQQFESAKAVVRNRTATRIRRAFLVALNKNGYNWLGAGISPQLDTRGKEIYGTVVLCGEDPQRVLLMEFPKLVDYFAQQIKDTIAPRLCRDAKGRNPKLLPEKSELEPGILDERRND